MLYFDGHGPANSCIASCWYKRDAYLSVECMHYRCCRNVAFEELQRRMLRFEATLWHFCPDLPRRLQQERYASVPFLIAVPLAKDRFDEAFKHFARCPRKIGSLATQASRCTGHTSQQMRSLFLQNSAHVDCHL